ncbi:MAG: hypothetical protein FJ264_15285 [Planctomycetes bacterium]|nr:hypothetical protein [Planctomycetota bacterium]
MRISVTIFLFILLVNRVVFALGECGLSCCLSDVTTSDVIFGDKFGLSLQYEYTKMGTIRDGDSHIGHNALLDEIASDWPDIPEGTESFSIPTRMIMQKYTFVGSYTASDRLQFLAYIPYLINDMDMKMRMRHQMDGDDFMDMDMKMEMETIEGLGDISIMGLYTVHADSYDHPTKRLLAGFGLKTPTGKNDENYDSGNRVHAMMQLGTGSWDPLFLINYMREFYPLVLQGNLLYHVSTEGDEGYEFGDQISIDIIARHHVNDYISPGLGLNGLHTGSDKDDDDNFSSPETSLLDNPDNTGITAFYITPSVNAKIPKTGCSADLKFQYPLYQHVRGIQQVVDWRILASVGWNF